MGESAIVPAPSAALAEMEPESFRQVVETCGRLCEQLRGTTMELHHQIGQQLYDEIQARKDVHYGSRLILRVEAITGMDRTELYRSIKLYEWLPLDSIVAAQPLSWNKAKMLVPLSPESLHKEAAESISGPRKLSAAHALIDTTCNRDALLERVISGELRTDDQVRVAILLMKEKLGLLTKPALRAEEDFHGIKGLQAEKIETLWRRCAPVERAAVTCMLVQRLELNRAPREVALKSIGEIEAEVARVRASLDGRRFRKAAGRALPAGGGGDEEMEA